MESKIDTIGLSIWGYKQGCKVLAAHGVDFQSQEIRERLKDISSFIRIHIPSVDFYTLEFTQNYKIYTQYRSSRDINGQTGVYIAISLYIPHVLQWRGVRQVLNLMMDMYFAERINADTNAPMQSERDDISPYYHILRGYEKQITEDYSVKSPQSQPVTMPKFLGYEDVYEVDKYFNTPYQHGFLAGQQIMFLRTDFIENPIAHRIDFPMLQYQEIQRQNDTPASNTQATERSHFIVTQLGIKILAFMKNGQDISATYTNEYFDENDEIELLLEKSKYYEVFSFRDTLKKGLERGIFRKTYNNYTFDTIPFVEKELKLYIRTPQLEYERYIPLLALESNYFKPKLYSDSRGYYFLLKGDEVHRIFDLSYNNIVFKSHISVEDKEFISVPFQRYNFTIVSNQLITVSLRINGISFSKKLRSDAPIEIILPEHQYHFEFESTDLNKVVSVSESGIVNFDVVSRDTTPQESTYETYTAPNEITLAQQDLASFDDEDEEYEDEKTPIIKQLWFKIASVACIILLLVGIGYWFIFPMLKDPVKAYIEIASESPIKDMRFLTNIDERTYDIDNSYIRLKNNLPFDEVKLIVNYDEEGQDTIAIDKAQLGKLSQMIDQKTKDTLKIETMSPARAFLAEVGHWKETHSDPNGNLFWAEAQRKHYLTDKLRPEFEKAVWENFLKDFDYSAFNSEQVDSLLKPYLKGSATEFKTYQKDLERIIADSRSRDNQTVVENEEPIRRERVVVDEPRRTEPKPAAPSRVDRVEETPKNTASNRAATTSFITDMKVFNSLACSEDVVDRVKLNAGRIGGSDWAVVKKEFNQEKKEIDARIAEYQKFFTALKRGGSIADVKPFYFGGQSGLINYLKKGNNFDAVKGKNLKTFAEIRKALIDSGVDPKNIR
jgi:hypothetical protein